MKDQQVRNPPRDLPCADDVGQDVAMSALPSPSLDASAIRKRIVNLAIPTLIESGLMTLVSMADMIMVGRLGPWAITSVGLSNQPMFIALSVFMALNVGATAMVARAIGAGDQSEASKVARQALTLAVTLGAVMGLLGFVFARDILLLMGARDDVIGPGTAYFKIVAIGLVFQGGAVSIGAALRGAGDTRTPMEANTVANIVNVIGNWLLIYGHLGFPRLEVVGAAIPTTLSRAVSCFLILRKVFSGNSIIKMSFSDSFLPDRHTMNRLLKVGLPAAGEQLVMRSGQMVFARIVSSFGTVTYAAHQVALNLEGLSFTPAQAFQTATTALVGQSLGAGDPARAEKVGWEARKVGLVLALIAALIFFFLGRYVVLLYTDDPSVISMSSGVLKLMALAQPFLVTNFITAGALRGAGDTRWAMYITFCGVWGVRVVVAYLLAIRLNMGLYGAWVGMVLDMAARTGLLTLRYRSGHWKKIKV